MPPKRSSPGPSERSSDTRSPCAPSAPIWLTARARVAARLLAITGIGMAVRRPRGDGHNIKPDREGKSRRSGVARRVRLGGLLSKSAAVALTASHGKRGDVGPLEQPSQAPLATQIALVGYHQVVVAAPQQTAKRQAGVIAEQEAGERDRLGDQLGGACENVSGVLLEVNRGRNGDQREHAHAVGQPGRSACLRKRQTRLLRVGSLYGTRDHRAVMLRSPAGG